MTPIIERALAQRDAQVWEQAVAQIGERLAGLTQVYGVSNVSILDAIHEVECVKRDPTYLDRERLKARIELMDNVLRLVDDPTVALKFSLTIMLEDYKGRRAELEKSLEKGGDGR